MDCAEGPLCLKWTTTQQLLIVRDETETIECVDLLTPDASSMIATYTGDSLLIGYLIPHDNVQRKFLVQFASTADQRAGQHCEECVALISRSITVTHLDASVPATTTAAAPDGSSTVVSVVDMIKALLGKDPLKLSTYYTQDVVQDRDELLERYLCDETFPDFVSNVAAILDGMQSAPT